MGTLGLITCSRQWRLLSTRVQLGCSRETCCWSRCRCHWDSTSSQVQPLLPWRWAWRSCGGVCLWSWRRRGQAPRVGRLLSPSRRLFFGPSRLSVVALYPSAGCWFPAEAASPYWWDWSPSLRTLLFFMFICGIGTVNMASLPPFTLPLHLL